MSQKYEYSPLPSPDHIRLARINAGAFEDELQIKLMAVSSRTANILGYSALSYVWGDESNPAILRVEVPASDNSGDTMHLKITQNLDVALRYLRESEPYELWWIDALCINQVNDAEKSSQVRKMGKLFRDARRVVAWLGAPGPEGEQGMKLLGDISSNFKFTVDFALGEIVHQRFESDDESWDSTSFNGYDLEFDVAEGLALLNIVERPWFRRIWIRQEIFLPDKDKAIVRCGRRSMAWHTFRSALAYVCRQHYTIVGNDEAMSRRTVQRLAAGFDPIRSFVFQRLPLRLDELRYWLQDAQCKDDRDRIFAALDLLNDDDYAIGIQPDYTKTACEVYTDVVHRYIKNRQSVEILRECSSYVSSVPLSDASSTPFSGVPSWVPQWSSCDPPVPNLSRVRMRASAYIAVSQYKPRIVEGSGMGQGSVLRAWGVAGPVVHSTGCSFYFGANRTDEERYADFRAALLLETPILDDLDAPSSCTPQSVIEQYADTLSFGNTTMIGSDATASSVMPLRRCITALRQILSYEKQPNRNTMNQYLRRDMEKFQLTVGGNLSRSRIACGSNGELLMVPDDAQEGDQVCALLGCSSTMLLRPSPHPDEQGRYRVVGPCYSSSMSGGDAFLGPLPDHFYRVISGLKNDHAWIKEGTISGRAIDPRLEPILQRLAPDVADSLRWELCRTSESPVTVDIEILREHRASVSAIGGDITQFDLI